MPRLFSKTDKLCIIIFLFYCGGPVLKGMNNACCESVIRIKLPEPRYRSDVSVEQALKERRSVRSYNDEPLTLEQVSQILWAAQGITDKRGFRTAPSGGALYPLDLYVVVGNVNGLDEGIYKYQPGGHSLVMVQKGDKRAELCDATYNQLFVKDAAVDLVFFSVYERITKKYGERGVRYAHIEVGHAAQNVYLQAVALNLDTVVVGAFRDDEVKKVISGEENEDPLYIMPLGKKPE